MVLLVYIAESLAVNLDGRLWIAVGIRCWWPNDIDT